MAKPGDFFVVTSNGIGQDITITLCLNTYGKRPLSCQNYTTKPGTLTIRTTPPNKAYQYAGIKIDTSGYAYDALPQTNGYCFIGFVSDTQTTTGTVSSLNMPLFATATPSTLSVNSGQIATFTANPEGGIAPYGYQWYSCTTFTCSSHTALPGETGITYNPSTATPGTYYYEAIVTDAAAATTATNVVILTVDNALSATVTPSNLSVNIGDAATFTANPLGGRAPYTYQWYSCTTFACSSTTAIPGETNNTYSPSTTTAGTYYYRASVTDSASTPETVTTNVATFTVSAPRYIIFVTAATFSGNLGGFAGADALCNADVAKPVGYTFKALLAGNNATMTGRAYYRTDSTTLIAIATGGDLVGANNLVNSISTSSSPSAWTGGNSLNNCTNWTSTASLGARGNPAAALNTYWNIGTSGCGGGALARALYCASQ